MIRKEVKQGQRLQTDLKNSFRRWLKSRKLVKINP